MPHSSTSAGVPPAAGRFDLQALRRLCAPLPAELQAAFDAQLDSGIVRLLRVLGPVCGASVILFGAWDAWIDPGRAPMTMRIRVLLALAGALSYARTRLSWPVRARCAWLYATHVGAAAACAALVPRGLVLALPGLTGAMFVLALVEPRPRGFLLSVLAPSVLLVALGAWSLPPALLLNTVLLYALSLPLALGVALAHLHLRRQLFLAEQAMLQAVRHDSLSGALSRAYLTELALHDVALATRQARPLAVAMLDIDWFKRVNDTYGHANGDAALCALVAACKDSLRASDYIGRVGGEEFVCVMPDSNQEDALACAERIRKTIAALRLPTETGVLRFTVSIGVAVLDLRDPDLAGLLRAADAALYAAKEAGRNRTVLARSGCIHP